jgi:hypothetical protein
MSNKNGAAMEKILLNRTSKVFDHYNRILKEQGEQLPDPNAEFDTSGGQSPDVTQNPAPASQEEVPMTSEGEEKYIADLIDAALFEPSSEDARTLTNLQGVMEMKRYKNAREEILPLVLNIIRPSTESSDIRDGLDSLNQ